MKKLLLISAILFTSFCLTGQDTTPPQTAESSLPQPAAPETVIVAEIDGHRITLADFKQRYHTIKPFSEGITAKAALDIVIDDYLLQVQSKGKDFPWESTQFDDFLNTRKEIYKAIMSGKSEDFQYSEAGFQSFLSANKISENELKKAAKEQFRIYKYIEQLPETQREIQQISYTNQDLWNYYRSHTTNFLVPSTVALAHIFFSLTDKNGATLNQEEAKNKKLKAAKALGRLTTHTPFKEVCYEYSEDEASIDYKNEDGETDCGYLGYLSYEEIERKFKSKTVLDQLLNYQKGQITAIIETPSAYQIFQIRDIKKGHFKSFRDSKTAIIKAVLKEKTEKIVAEARAELLEKIIKESSIKKYPDRIKDL